jgi:ribosomal small subunit protein bTHX
MGKGDKKTRRGKLFQGSFGVRRRKNKAGKAVRTVKAKEVIPAATEVKAPVIVPEVKATKATPAKKAPKAKKSVESTGKNE